MDNVERLREEYAEGEADRDRNPTDDGFVRWLADQAMLARQVQARQVDEDTVGVTIHGVDVHVRDEGDETDQITVSVGAEEAPGSRRVVVQDWTGIYWEQVVRDREDGGDS